MIEEGEQFVRLPNQYEINEYRVMEDFADFAGGGLKYVSKEQANVIGQKLYEALQGRGCLPQIQKHLKLLWYRGRVLCVSAYILCRTCERMVSGSRDRVYQRVGQQHEY